jgi:LysR family positive regulator for ilvC
MDLRELKLFLHLAESKHFGKTAKATYVSPSTLSRQIQRLEDELGQTLFLRDNRTVQLTEAGEHLRQFALHTLNGYKQLLNTFKQQETMLTGELHLYCSVTAAYSHLPSILDKFRARYPAVEIKLTTGDAADAVDTIQSNDADLAIAGHPENLPSSVEFTKIGEVPLVLIAPALPCQVLTQVSQPSPEWSKVPFILPEHGPTRKRIDKWFKGHHVSNPLIYATVAGHEAIASMVALECGVALIPEVVLQNCPEAVRHRISVLDKVIMHTPFELGVCVLRKRLDEPLISAFWQIL